jgi:hypothetical protein
MTLVVAHSGAICLRPQCWAGARLALVEPSHHPHLILDFSDIDTCSVAQFQTICQVPCALSATVTCSTQFAHGQTIFSCDHWPLVHLITSPRNLERRPNRVTSLSISFRSLLEANTLSPTTLSEETCRSQPNCDPSPRCWAINAPLLSLWLWHTPCSSLLSLPTAFYHRPHTHLPIRTTHVHRDTPCPHQSPLSTNLSPPRFPSYPPVPSCSWLEFF